jgi:hypothetical protein
MIRTGAAGGLSKVTIAVVVSALLGVACDEEGKTAPATCADPPLPIYDISAGAPAEPGDQVNPCVTPVGDAYSPPTDVGGSTGLPPSGSGGEAGDGAGGASNAGAGGA